jgi:polyferredoxin
MNTMKNIIGSQSEMRCATRLRHVVQIYFIVLILAVGFQFAGFVHSLSSKTSNAPVARPPAVEGFLPISSLMSFVYLVKTGIANHVHPAGLVIFTLTLALALFIRRGFCSWVCPIGALSEFLQKAGRGLTGLDPAMPRALDGPMRGLKFVLLGFFLWFILRMPVDALAEFIRGPYNRIADVKMYLFFANLSRTALQVLIALAVLSVVFKNFWCRYLCPYGALLGLISLASPVAVRRDEAKCIGCGACAKACPNRIAVDKAQRVNSAECMACFSCVGACPSHGALRMALLSRSKPITMAVYGFITFAVFLVMPHIAAAFHYWQTDTTPGVYRVLYREIRGIGYPRYDGSREGRLHSGRGNAMHPEDNEKPYPD